MAELFESSGLLSLASLREHEKKQAHEQAEAARARAEAEQRARLGAEREAARREQERQREARLAREFAESAERAERLRVEVAQRAEAQRASALSRSAEELRLSLSHEREARRTGELGLTAQLLRQRLFTSLASALCLGSWIGAFALYFGALRPAADRALGAAQQALIVEQRAHTEAEANLLRGARRADELSARVASLEQRLREASSVRPSPAPTPSSIVQKKGSRPPAVTGPVKPCRDDGDPLNPCLRH
jgi:hypothetical protein